ncbi:20S-pre-rRNA D-site endonuclease NOB1 [Trichophyton interdigitale]|nr:20S-pre-rRNA D-site endonuclease NOB1 [Trichophyton interdigitale]
MSEKVDTKEPEKPVHTIILDAGPLIKNVPSVSTLLSQSHVLVTTPSIVSEIRDPEARRRIETLYLPFLTQRTPKPTSLKVVSEFAKKTGDREVLSKNDLEILALAYELECERNCGDWRLRREPGQKGINGSPPAHLIVAKDAAKDGEKQPEIQEKQEDTEEKQDVAATVEEQQPDIAVEEVTQKMENTTIEPSPEAVQEEPTSDLPDKDNENPGNEDVETIGSNDDDEQDAIPIDESDSDPDGWITPSNLKKRQIRDAALGTAAPETKVMQVATITGDFAMQNVLLQMNLNILSPSNMQQIRQLKSYVMRCHESLVQHQARDSSEYI